MKSVSGLFAEITTTYFAMAPYLMLGLVFAGILHVLFKKEFIVKHLGSNSFGSVLKASLLGVPLPLCSCSVVPTALSLRKNNASIGASVSFLISTPQTGVDSIAATYGMLGPVFAFFRPIAALIMGIVGGVVTNIVVKKSSVQSVAMPSSFPCVICKEPSEHTHSWLDKMRAMSRYACIDFLDDITIQLMIGIVIAGVLSFFIPPDFFVTYVNNDFLGMILMMLLGIPMYVCATASIPIALALMDKGLSPGAAFVFLACGPATNAATIALINKAMGTKIIGIYLGVIAVCSLAAGFALNWIYSLTGAAVPHAGPLLNDSEGTSSFEQIVSFVFLGLLCTSLYRIAKSKFASGSSKKCNGTDCCT